MKTTIKLATLTCLGLAASSANATFVSKINVVNHVINHFSNIHTTSHNPCPSPDSCNYYGFGSAQVETGNAANIDSLSSNVGNVVYTNGGLGVNSHLLDNHNVDKIIKHESITITFNQPTEVAYFTLGDITTGAQIDMSYANSIAGTSGSMNYTVGNLQLASDRNFYLGESVTSITFAPGNLLTDFNVKGVCVEEVPVPAAAWLFGSALAGLAGLRRKK